MAQEDHIISDAGELVGETALLDDGPPFRYSSVRSRGRCDNQHFRARLFLLSLLYV